MRAVFRVFAVCALVLGLTISSVGMQPAKAVGNIIYVDADAVGSFDGTSWANAYKRLQNALAAASSGDEIWVATGVYYPDEGAAQTNNDRSAAFEIPAGVSIYGGFAGTESHLTERSIALNPTILSGDIDQNDDGGNSDGNNITEYTDEITGSNSYHVVSIDSVNNVIVSGFTVTAANSDAGLASCLSCGGGMDVRNSSQITLSFINFFGNYAAAGGALHIKSSNGTSLADILFIGNAGDTFGGAIYVVESDNVSMTNATFLQNEANNGGAFVLNQSENATITNFAINDNHADMYGGGVSINDFSTITMMDGTFSLNEAYYGGAVVTNNSTSSLFNITLNGNNATDGGAFYTYGVSGSILDLENATVGDNAASNFGGAFYNSNSSLNLKNITISGGSAASGGGFYNDIVTVVSLKNSIVANTVSGGDCVNLNGSFLNPVEYSLFEDASVNCGVSNGVNGNITGGDPMLGPLQDNGGLTQTYALMPDSPAINRGSNADCPVDDQRGIARPFDTTCDIGAYESVHASFKSNGTHDGWVLESSETSGKGGTLNSTAASIQLGDDSSDRQYRGFLSFDTNTLPEGAVLLFATIKVKKSGVTGINPFSTHGNFVCDIRSGSFGSSNSLATGDFKSTSSMNNAGIFASISNGWYRAPLSSNALGFLNTAGFTQCRLRFTLDDNDDRGSDMLKIYSGNSSNNSSRPVLLVEYYIP